MSFNEKLSYTEHSVVSPTSDFTIGFEDYALTTKDRINVTVDDIDAKEAGYTVTRKNNLVVTLTPPVSSGVVRLQRETNIDTPFHRFTAGAKFVASNVDQNFTQILHSQQEVRNLFGFTQDYIQRTLDNFDLRIQGVEGIVLDLRRDYKALDKRLTNEVADRDRGDRELKDYIDSTVNGITGEPFLPIHDSFVLTEGGQTQRWKNAVLGKHRLGHSVYFDNLPSSLNPEGKYYPQGGCKVGDSLFVKVGTNVGTVGTSTETFIIAEYNFKTGELISETQPMQTLGHHELSGFIKDGKTYLVTSYEPSSDSLSRSGVGISVIEWKGKETTLADVKQYVLLSNSQYIGFPAVDEDGEYVYICNSKYGANGGSGLLQRGAVLNIQVHKLADIQVGVIPPLYNLNIAIPSGDGLVGSDSLNGFAATKDYLYVVFGGAYGRAEVHQYTVNGDFIGKIQTALGRSARPYNEVITEDMYLYNNEPEGIFTDDNAMYLLTVEEWYGAGEFVKFNGGFYMARYGMTGKSPASHVDHWASVKFTPSVWSEYSPTTTYAGRNTSKSLFKRVLLKVELKTHLNYDLLMSDSVGSIPNLISNIADRVHIYGTLQKGNTLNFGHYDYERQTFQKNMSMVANGLALFDTRYTSTLNAKSASVLSYQSGTSQLLRLMANTSFQNDALLLYGKYHGSSDNSTPHPYLARWESDNSETAVFYRDGRFYNYSKNTAIAAKFFVSSEEVLGLYRGPNGATLIDSSNTYTWFGKSSGGVHDSATFGVNHDSKTLYPPSDGGCTFGMSGQRWARGWFQNLNINALSVYADNTAAKAGGLVVGEVYRTATGQLMIVY